MNTTLTAKEHVERIGRLLLQRLRSDNLERIVDDFMKGLEAHPGTAFLADPSHGMREVLLQEGKQGREVVARRIRNIPIDYFIVD